MYVSVLLPIFQRKTDTYSEERGIIFHEYSHLPSETTRTLYSSLKTAISSTCLILLLGVFCGFSFHMPLKCRCTVQGLFLFSLSTVPLPPKISSTQMTQSFISGLWCQFCLWDSRASHSPSLFSLSSFLCQTLFPFGYIQRTTHLAEKRNSSPPQILAHAYSHISYLSWRFL